MGWMPFDLTAEQRHCEEKPRDGVMGYQEMLSSHHTPRVGGLAQLQDAFPVPRSLCWVQSIEEMGSITFMSSLS